VALRVAASASLDESLRREILALCKRAYGEDLTALFRSVGPALHVIARDERRVVSHAMWVTRHLQPGGAARSRSVTSTATSSRRPRSA